MNYHAGGMRRVEVSADVLRGTAIFAGLSDADRAALAVCFVGRAYGRGEIVVREGDPGDAMMVIAAGTFVATMRRHDGGEEVLNRMSAGEVAGEMTFLDPAPRSATVTAATEGIVYELSHDAMEILRARAPAAVSAIVTVALADVTRRLRTLDDRVQLALSRLSQLPVDPRLEP